LPDMFCAGGRSTARRIIGLIRHPIIFGFETCLTG